MRVLLTGGTGFLGKEFLNQILKCPELETIGVLTRRHLTHPDPRVKVLHCDITDPIALEQIEPIWDQVVHLAGLYHFGQSYAQCYLNNVMGTAQLAAWQKAHNPALKRFHHASTYAVTVSQRENFCEAALPKVPAVRHAYASSKALAESVLLKTNLPLSIYRLGILVGSSADGHIEKIDGPYYLLRFLYKLKRHGLARVLPSLPLPAAARAMLPFVPVDIAAQVLVRGLKHPPLTHQQIYGVYNSKSLSAQDFVHAACQHFGIRAKPIFLGQAFQPLSKAQEFVTGIPQEALSFAMKGPKLKNEAFLRDFPEITIPRFRDYKDSFFRGLDQSLEHSV